MHLLTALKNKLKNITKVRYAIIGLIYLTVITTLSYNFTHAYFSDQASSNSNTFAAASVFPTTSGQPTNTPTEAPTPTGTVTLTSMPTPSNIATNLIINEVLYDTTSNQDVPNRGEGEFVELHNPTNSPININNWTIADNQSTETFSDITIPANGFLIISGEPLVDFQSIWTLPAGTLYFDTLDAEIGGGLSNSGDRLILKNNNGTIIDQISWESDTSILNPSLPDSTTGKSHERNPDGLDTNSASDFTINNTPQPGV